ncbi:MAG: hypothetical protein JWN95_1369 [Frankiales bacterium]|nr:hypothetical protein [Frankiales bacterium]
MPGVDQLVKITGWCRRSVQYALDALEQLGCARRVAQGRNWLSRTERLQLWARGSQARSYRAIWALTERVRVVDKPRPQPSATCTLPTGLVDSSSSSSLDVGSTSESTSKYDCGRSRSVGLPAQRQEEAAPPPASTTARRRGQWEDGLIQVVVDLQRALPAQLRGERPGRLAGSLNRFYRHGWTALGLEAEIRELYTRKQRPLPYRRPERPFAWLAAVLRELDPEENPDLYGPVDRHNTAISSETPCQHGVDGGEQVQYKTGRMRCPLCRAEHRIVVSNCSSLLGAVEPSADDIGVILTL